MSRENNNSVATSTSKREVLDIPTTILNKRYKIGRTASSSIKSRYPTTYQPKVVQNFTIEDNETITDENKASGSSGKRRKPFQPTISAKKCEMSTPKNDDFSKVLKLVPREKLLGIVFASKIRYSNNELALQFGLPVTFVNTILNHKHHILQDWKYNTSSDKFHSPIELENIIAINEVLTAWKRRSLYEGLPITDTHIKCKANFLKRVFHLPEFNVSKEWLKNFTMRSDKTPLQDKPGGYSLDIRDIVSDLNAESPLISYEQFQIRLSEKIYPHSSISRCGKKINDADCNSKSDVEIVKPVDVVGIADDCGVEGLELENIVAINEVLAEWKRRSLYEGLPITDTHIMCKANFLKRVFLLPEFNVSKEWLTNFNMRSDKPPLQAKPGGYSLDIRDIVSDLNAESSLRSYEKFKHWLTDKMYPYSTTSKNFRNSGKKNICNIKDDNDANCSSGSDVEEVVQPINVVDIADDCDLGGSAGDNIKLMNEVFENVMPLIKSENIKSENEAHIEELMPLINNDYLCSSTKSNEVAQNDENDSKEFQDILKIFAETSKAIVKINRPSTNKSMGEDTVEDNVEKELAQVNATNGKILNVHSENKSEDENDTIEILQYLETDSEDEEISNCNEIIRKEENDEFSKVLTKVEPIDDGKEEFPEGFSTIKSEDIEIEGEEFISISLEKKLQGELKHCEKSNAFTQNVNDVYLKKESEICCSQSSQRKSSNPVITGTFTPPAANSRQITLSEAATTSRLNSNAVPIVIVSGENVKSTGKLGNMPITSTDEKILSCNATETCSKFADMPLTFKKSYAKSDQSLQSCSSKNDQTTKYTNSEHLNNRGERFENPQKICDREYEKYPDYITLNDNSYQFKDKITLSMDEILREYDENNKH